MATTTKTVPLKRMRCAIYTRKSSEEGLDMEFNSLDAQREACEAYIASQKSEGWAAIRERYDDGGYSGGSLDRPALSQLIKDIEAGLVDVVVVYKIDRLSRSLIDFTKLVEVFDRNNVTFVSVTQSFNTTTSMGRLTLNILLSFAQFEREVIGERIRDKFAASKKRGMWMGGFVPLGYDVKERKLVINEPEAKIVRLIFQKFVSLGSATILARVLQADGVRNKRGRLLDKGIIYKILHNRIYLGEIFYKGTSYPGEHQAIVTQDMWDAAHEVMKENSHVRGNKNRGKSGALLKGLIYTTTGSAMTPTFTMKGERRYHYYASMDHIRGRLVPEGSGPVRLPGGMVDSTVVAEMRRLIATPEIAAQILEKFERENIPCDQRELLAALRKFDGLWEVLFPAERTRVVRLLVARVTVGAEGMAIDLRNDGLGTLAQDLMSGAVA